MTARRFWLSLLGALTLIAWAPLVLAITATSIASFRGCRLTEAGPQPCLLAGQDIGGLLHGMSMMWWVSMLTFFPSLLLLMVWIIVWRRGRS